MKLRVSIFVMVYSVLCLPNVATSSHCKCRMPAYRRQACPSGGNLSAEACSATGCCFLGDRINCYAPYDEVDLILLVDASRQIGPSSFGALKQWLKSFTSSIDLKSGQIQVGLVKYSSSITDEVRLGAVTDQDAMDAAIDRIWHDEDARHTAQAVIDTATMDMQNPVKIRHNVRRVILLVSAGPTENPRSLSTAGDAARQRGVEIFGLGVGSPPPLGDLLIVTGDPSRVITADFDKLETITSHILHAMEIC